MKIVDGTSYEMEEKKGIFRRKYQSQLKYEKYIAFDDALDFRFYSYILRNKFDEDFRNDVKISKTSFEIRPFGFYLSKSNHSSFRTKFLMNFLNYTKEKGLNADDDGLEVLKNIELLINEDYFLMYEANGWVYENKPSWGPVAYNSRGDFVMNPHPKEIVDYPISTSIDDESVVKRLDDILNQLIDEHPKHEDALRRKFDNVFKEVRSLTNDKG